MALIANVLVVFLLWFAIRRRISCTSLGSVALLLVIAALCLTPGSRRTLSFTLPNGAALDILIITCLALLISFILKHQVPKECHPFLIGAFVVTALHLCVPSTKFSPTLHALLLLIYPIGVVAMGVRLGTRDVVIIMQVIAAFTLVHVAIGMLFLARPALAPGGMEATIATTGRLRGLFGGPNDMGILIICGYCTLASLPRSLRPFVLAILSVAIVLTGSRLALGATFACVLLMGLYAVWTKRLNISQLTTSALALLTIALIAFMGLGLSAALLGRFAQGIQVAEEAERVLTYETGLRAIGASPLIGVGPGAVYAHSTSFSTASIVGFFTLFISDTPFGKTIVEPHSALLLIGVEFGLIVLASFCIILAWAVRKSVLVCKDTWSLLQASSTAALAATVLFASSLVISSQVAVVGWILLTCASHFATSIREDQ